MNMEIIGRAVVSLPKLWYYKVKYRSRIELPMVQSFGKHVDIRIDRKGYISLGRETVSRQGLILRAEGGSLTIGDKCFFNTNCSITCMDSIQIGKACQIANNVVIIDHDHDYRKPLGAYKTAPVIIGDRVWIGANCIILKGSKIGDGAVIGAGSVVKGTVGANAVFVQKRICQDVY